MIAVPCRHALAALSLVLAVTAVYARTAGYGFVMLDDFTYVVTTPELRAGLTLDGVLWALQTFRGMMWMPLTWISYMAEISVFGIDPGAQHVTNVVLHALNALLFYALALRVLGRVFVAWMIAMLFGIHPIHVESVAWIAERKDVLFGLFYLAALLAFLAWQERRSALRYTSLLVLSAAAMMAKPMAISLPVAMLLLSWWPLGRFAGLRADDPRAAWRACVRLAPAIVPVAMLAAGVAVLTILVARSEMLAPTSVSLGFRLGNALYSIAAYLWDIVLPVGLSPMYPLRTLLLFQQFLPALATVLAAAGAAWWWRRERPWLGFALLWFVLCLLPVSGIFQIGPQARADRFVYVPALGVYLALGAELARAPAAWLARWRAPIAAILLAYGAMAWVQVGYWANVYMFSTRILDVVGDNVDAHVGLVQVYLDAGDIDAAERHARAAYESAPGHYQAYTVLGNVHLARRNYAEAEQMFRIAIERRPDYFTPYLNLAIALRGQGRDAEAQEVLDRLPGAEAEASLQPRKPVPAPRSGDGTHRP